MQKRKYSKIAKLQRFISQTLRVNLWAILAPLITLIVGVTIWLTLALSKTARLDIAHFLRSVPEPVSNSEITLLTSICLVIAISLYFLLDYTHQKKLYLRDDPTFIYTAVHHAKKVILPKVKYNWKQIAYWLGYGVASFLLVAGITVGHVRPVYAYAPDEFVTTWNPANDGDLNVNIYANVGVYTYNYNVDWGDGTSNTNVTDNISHNYSSAGLYTVKITGDYPQPLLGYSTDLESVEQWGNMQWKSMNESFSNTGNISINATDSPDLSQVTDMSYMFSDSGMNSDISGWDTSHVQNMDQMFRSNSLFNQPIGSWDTSSLTSAELMFGNASAFNQPLNSWNTSSLTNAYGMFDYATSFNQPLNNWDTSNVTNMNSMFTGASAFNQPLNNWDTSNVTNMNGMFALANSFDQSLGSWDVSNVTDMGAMFGFTGYYTGLSTYNYDSTLVNWSTLSLQMGVTFEAGTSEYCNSATQRSYIASTYGWSIHDGGASCVVNSTLPIVTTGDVTSLTQTTATLNGEVIDDNGDAITSAGFQYSTSTAYENDTGSITTSIGPYSTAISSLTCGTKYYVRAYATNSTGTGYGTSRPFNTVGCPFVTKWKTDNYGGDSKTITIPTTGGGYNYDVDWGDGNTSSGVTGNATHVYAIEGTYTVSITGDFPRIYINNSSEIKEKLLSVESWGSMHWDSMQNAFFGATNLIIPATDTPDLSNVTDADRMFEGCESLTTSNAINDWDVSHITSMWVMFGGATNFNSSIENWNVSNVNNFGAMFSGAASFNQPINSWQVGNVTHMTVGGGSGGMFSNAISFNQPLDAWDVSSVPAFNDMFAGASSFNQPLDTWDVSNATDMSNMFGGASSFNQPLDAWNVSAVTSMYSMLENTGLSTANYDATLIAWSSQSVQSGVPLSASPTTFCTSSTQRASLISDYNWSITDGGENCPDFTNAFITTWKTDNPGTSNSNQVTIPTSPFGFTYNFDVDWGDGNITTGETGSVIHTYSTAGEYTIKIIGTFPAIYFNNSGDKEKILSVDQWGDQQWADMTRAFYGASNLHIDASDTPDLQNVTFATSMFQGASAMNEDISGWDVSQISDLSYMFYGATSFNQPLDSWVLNSSIFGSGTIFMFHGATSFNKPLDNWNVGNVTNMWDMFGGATSFNQDISGWSTAQVTNMSYMFEGATSFNQPLDNWNVANVTNLYSMFNGAINFDQTLGSWDVSQVSDMGNMLVNTALSTANYDNTLIGWSSQSLQTDVPLDASAHYCAAETQRQSIIDDFSWTITDAGKDCSDAYKQVNTIAPDKLSSSQVRLNGSVSGAGAGNFVSAGFEWGETQSYGNTISNLSISSNAFSSIVTLECDTQYHYRAFAVDGSNNKTYGANTTFTLACPTPTTPENPPTVTTNPTTPPTITTDTHRAPVVSIDTPTEGQGFTTGSNIGLVATVTAGTSPIKEVRFYINGELYTTLSGSAYEATLPTAQNGIYKFIVVAEDTAGYETATSERTFSVSKLGTELPLSVLPDTSGGLNTVAKQYLISGLPAAGARALPWILLALLAAGYLTQAGTKMYQNKQLKKKIIALGNVAAGLDVFTQIASHYLATPITTMSLSLESMKEKNDVVDRLQTQLSALKDHINQLIAGLGVQTQSIKSQLSYAGRVKHYSRIVWVVAPSIVAGILLIVSVAGMARLGLWSASKDEIVFNVSFYVASVALTILAFEVWQHQRQIESDLRLAHNEAGESLDIRTNLITENRLQLQQEFKPIEDGLYSLPGGSQTALFSNGVAEFKRVLSAFGAVSLLTTTKTDETATIYSPNTVVHALQTVAQHKGLIFNYKGPEQLTTRMLPAEVDKVIQTLVENAINFTDGNGTISVQLRSSARHLTLKVTDTGAGISKQKIDSLMQPFARGTTTETYNYEGIGLNLYIVRLIAERHGGRVTIVSTEGRGTTVTFKA